MKTEGLTKRQNYSNIVPNNIRQIGIVMDIREIRLDDLYLDPNNARLHDDRNIQAIKGSLKKFGQQKNIVVNKDGMILAGNGTYAAAKLLGWETLTCNVTTLEGFTAMAYALADNRTAELATWDLVVLQDQLKMIDEPKLIGFEDDFTKIDEPKTETIEGSKELDEDDFDNFDHQCPKCGFEWDDKK